MAPKKTAKRRTSEANIDKQELSPTPSTVPAQSQISREPKASSGKKTRASSRTPSSKKKDPAKQLYEATIKAVDKTFNQLVKKYKPNPKGWYGITADDFAAAMAQYTSDVRKLQEYGDSSLAFNLLLDLGEHAYGDLEACVKASGFGDTGEPYQKMDRLLAEIIDTRRREEEPAKNSAQDTPTAEGENEKAEYKIRPFKDDLGTEETWLHENIVNKDRGPNKQQWGQLNRAHLADLHKLFDVRWQRHATTMDWAGGALNELHLDSWLEEVRVSPVTDVEPFSFNGRRLGSSSNMARSTSYSTEGSVATTAQQSTVNPDKKENAERIKKVSLAEGLRTRLVEFEERMDDPKTAKLKEVIVPSAAAIRLKQTVLLRDKIKLLFSKVDEFQSDTSIYDTMEELSDAINDWKSTVHMTAVTNRDFAKDLKHCKYPSNKAVFQRTVLISILNCHHISDKFDFNCEGTWSLPSSYYALPSTEKNSIPSPKPDLAIFCRFDSLVGRVPY
ncbi:hypothetical protein F4678DRAFT_467830 [Xylaria arbuscula]|nr:hypothetical protein F4678DRAFT_467830 [Xylaria arbuscula]